MTDAQRTEILALRAENKSYKEIAEHLKIPVNTVKSYIRRQAIAEDEKRRKELGITLCENCSAEIQQRPGKKHKRFCSDRCRTEWWNNHPELINRKAIYDHSCLHCGKAFLAYGNARRKYCSHECYIADRFGGGSDD